jgi:hypothetical protein
MAPSPSERERAGVRVSEGSGTMRINSALQRTEAGTARPTAERKHWTAGLHERFEMLTKPVGQLAAADSAGGEIQKYRIKPDAGTTPRSSAARGRPLT